LFVFDSSKFHFHAYGMELEYNVKLLVIKECTGTGVFLS